MKQAEKHFMKGYSPLFVAIANKQYDTVRYLLANGVGGDIHDKDNNGNTILHVLVENNHSQDDLSIVAFLLQQGADPYARNNDGISAERLANDLGRTGLRNALLPQKTGLSVSGFIGTLFHHRTTPRLSINEMPPLSQQLKPG